MCDIYAEPCKVCGEKIAMHLGDFNTDQFEIMYICSSCSKKLDVKKLVKYIGLPAVVWKHSDGEKYIIFALTKNAWENREHNHVNEGGTEIIKEENS